MLERFRKKKQRKATAAKPPLSKEAQLLRKILEAQRGKPAIDLMIKQELEHGAANEHEALRLVSRHILKRQAQERKGINLTGKPY